MDNENDLKVMVADLIALVGAIATETATLVYDSTTQFGIKPLVLKERRERADAICQTAKLIRARADKLLPKPDQ